MYIKWIICRVKENERQKFSEAQEKWERISNADGFIAQTGGWDFQNKNDACIISFWKNKKFLDAFMTNIHNEIIKDNKQINTYDKISVDYFKSIFEMDSENNSLFNAANNGKLLRIADCIVDPEKIDHFGKMQSEIWLREMQKSEGMLGGVFAENENYKTNYLLATFWKNTDNHKVYTNTKLHQLRKESYVESDTGEITGRLISIVSKWKVIKT